MFLLQVLSVMFLSGMMPPTPFVGMPPPMFIPAGYPGGPPPPGGVPLFPPAGGQFHLPQFTPQPIARSGHPPKRRKQTEPPLKDVSQHPTSGTGSNFDTNNNYRLLFLFMLNLCIAVQQKKQIYFMPELCQETVFFFCISPVVFFFFSVSELC